MNFSAAALRLMADKGLTLLDVADIVAANDIRPDPTAKERQRRCRANKNGHAVTVTRDTFPNDRDILTPSIPPVISDEITPPSENQVLKPEHVVEAWNEMATRTGLPTIRKLTPDRMQSLRRRIKENTIQDFTEAIDAIERSPFLRGDSKRGWRANFDFLLSPTKFNRILEGTYAE